MASKEAVNGPLLFNEQHQSQAKVSKRKQRTFIVPTAFGVAFGVMSLILFFMATGYANNLIFIFFFMLISIALTGMLLTNRNVKNLDFVDIRIDSVFAQEQTPVFVHLKNSTKYALWDFEIFFEKMKLAPVAFSLATQSEVSIQVPFFHKTRGKTEIPRLTVQSQFPFGLLRAWRRFKVSSKEVIVFPSRRGVKEFPQKIMDGSKSHDSGTFRDHRVYQAGDSVRRIDWKASARRREVLVKNYEESIKPTLNFKWEHTEHLSDYEVRISQLTVWIDQAEQQNYNYSLQLGSQMLGPSQGKEHWLRCLEKLALLSPEVLK